MRNYEIMYIIRPTLESEAIKEVVAYFNEILTSNNANVLEFKEWGLRDLAYEIEKHKKGYYVWLKVEADVPAVNEFNRLIRINESVIRYIIVKEGDNY